MDGHEVGAAPCDRVPPGHELIGLADHRAVHDRRIQLLGAGREEHLPEVDETASQATHVAVGEPIGDDRGPESRDGEHPPGAVAADRGVVDGHALPVGERVGVVRGRIGERQGDVAAAAHGSTDGQVGGEFGDAVHRHVTVVESLWEPGRDLDRGVELQSDPDPVSDSAAL